jgi:hypothetical protein
MVEQQELALCTYGYLQVRYSIYVYTNTPLFFFFFGSVPNISDIELQIAGRPKERNFTLLFYATERNGLER